MLAEKEVKLKEQHKIFFKKTMNQLADFNSDAKV